MYTGWDFLSIVNENQIDTCSYFIINATLNFIYYISLIIKYNLILVAAILKT